MTAEFDAFYVDILTFQLFYERTNKIPHLSQNPISEKDGKIKLHPFEYLKEKRVLCQVHYIPVYWHPCYQRLGYKKGLCPKAGEFYERIINIPIYPCLSNEEQELVIKKIKEFFNN